MASGIWYYAKDNRQNGPVDQAALRELVAHGVIGPTDMVWTIGMKSWRQAVSIPGLQFPQPAPARQVSASAWPQAMQLPYATPERDGFVHRRRDEQPEYPPAGFWLRFFAIILDRIICFLGMVTVFSIGIFIGHVFSSPAAGIDIGFILFLTFPWFYFALMESSSTRATIGKMALGLQVTDLYGDRISFGRATGRYFGKIISGFILMIGFMMAGWTSQKQALHDMMAGTLVIRNRI